MAATVIGPRDVEVRRILERYLVEVVERFDLCPWARSARVNDEIAVEIVWGQAEPEAFVAAARTALARPGTRVAMVIAPELHADLGELGVPGPLRVARDHVVAAIREAGVADFHPASPLDLATPARLVPFLRRSPDPLLQLVPLALLDSVREEPPAVDRALQAQIMAGTAPPPRGDLADRIAAANHARIKVDLAAMVAALESIAADRLTSYAGVGISAYR